MKKMILPMALVATLALAACNTVEGAGKDMKSAGDTVTGAAKKNGAR